MKRVFLFTLVALAALGGSVNAQETATPTRPQYEVLTPVFFGFNSIEISDSTHAALLRVAATLVANPEAVLTLVGHTDERGADSYNLRLGRHRASAVAAFLAAHGVAASRLGTTSAGEREPLQTGHDVAAWAQNRRVEFRVKDNRPLRIPQR